MYIEIYNLLIRTGSTVHRTIDIPVAEKISVQGKCFYIMCFRTKNNGFSPKDIYIKIYMSNLVGEVSCVALVY